MDTAWQIKRDLAPGISNNRVDEAYQVARRAGARGGKLLGAGGRGFLCLYVEPEHQASVRSALPDLQEVPFAFSSAGSQIIFKAGHER
jgi:D-glycero-alpha-D-manno-heptose-7-phosphate kinase